MYTKGQMLDNGSPVTVFYDKPDNKEAKGRWEVGFAVSCEGQRSKKDFYDFIQSAWLI